MAFVCDQVLRGRIGVTDPSNPTLIYLDPANGVVQSTLLNVNVGFFGGLYAQGANPNIQIFSSLLMDDGTSISFSNGSSISENGNNLIINAPGSVEIANLNLSNINVNVNLDSINSALNNLNNDVSNLQNQDANLSNSISNAYNQANSAFNTANSAFNGANSALNIANSAYNQANSATILAGNAYNQANSYLNSLNTNQLILSTSELIFKANLSSSPQVSLNSNGATLPFFSVERTFGGDTAQSIVEPLVLSVSHNITSTASDEQPYLVMTDINAITQVGIYSGPNVPTFSATGGSLYLQNDGQFYTYDGANWASQALGGKITCKDILVRDNANSNTLIHIDPANISGLVINTNGGSETPQITVDKFNSSSDGISVLSHENLTITHVYSVEDQNYPYVQFFDSASTALINASIYFGNNAPTHTSLVGNGSLFIQGGSTPNLYQFNGTAWAGVGGGGGGSTIAQRVISVGLSTGQALPNTARFIVNFDTTESNSGDTGAYFIWNGAGSRFEVINSGIYWVGAGLAIDYSATVPAGQLSTMWVTINGSAVRQIDDFAVSNGAPDPMVLKAGRYLNLNAGAYLQVEVSQNFSGGSTINGDSTFLDLSYFEMARVV